MEQLSLFDDRKSSAPLASRLRPKSLEEFVGQKHLVGEGKDPPPAYRKGSDFFHDLLGTAGSGQDDAGADHRPERPSAEFHRFQRGHQRDQGDQGGDGTRRRSAGRWGSEPLLFVDEIHRFNKAQQDAFLPYVEKGSILLIGATTENPVF